MAGFSYGVLSFTERHRWFAIIWLFMSIQIKKLKNARYLFSFDWSGYLWYIFVHRIFAQVLWSLLFYYRKFSLIFLIVVVNDVRRSMKLIKSKEFVVLWPWSRIEAGYNCAVYDIPGDFSAMRLGVEVRKLYVWSCVHYFKYFLILSSRRAVIRKSIIMAWGVIMSTKNILIVAWLS